LFKHKQWQGNQEHIENQLFINEVIANDPTVIANGSAVVINHSIVAANGASVQINH
jgi:hypothetical protein